MNIFTLISILLLSSTIQIQRTNALNINLNSLWDYMFGDDNDYDEGDIRTKLIVPRKDLIHELGGEENYKLLIQDALGLSVSTTNEEKEEDEDEESNNHQDDQLKNKNKYGVDISFPMHHLPSSTPSSSSTNNEIDQLQMKQSKVYQEYIQQCNEFYSSSTTNTNHLPCTQSEINRIDMNLNQPQLMQNYTMIGFYKTSIPKKLLHQLQSFWKINYNKQKMEAWGSRSSSNTNGDSLGDGIVNADTHVNHWTSPTYMVHIDNPYLEGGGMELKNYIWQVVRLKLENWINNGGGMNGLGNFGARSNDIGREEERKWTLSPTSLYGIRVYKSGSILAPHVDRLPLVTSAIINVDQDVDEDWPLEVIGHDGVAYNVTMKPGDMIFYESHSIIHGKRIVSTFWCLDNI